MHIIGILFDNQKGIVVYLYAFYMFTANLADSNNISCMSYLCHLCLMIVSDYFHILLPSLCIYELYILHYQDKCTYDLR